MLSTISLPSQHLSPASPWQPVIPHRCIWFLDPLTSTVTAHHSWEMIWMWLVRCVRQQCYKIGGYCRESLLGVDLLLSNSRKRWSPWGKVNGKVPITEFSLASWCDGLDFMLFYAAFYSHLHSSEAFLFRLTICWQDKEASWHFIAGMEATVNVKCLWINIVAHSSALYQVSHTALLIRDVSDL